MRFLLTVLLVLAPAVEAATAVDVFEPQEIMIGDDPRSYYLHVPEGLGEDAPLVIVLHGLGGRAEKLRYGTRLNAIADANGFAVAYPQGEDFRPTSSHWNADFPYSEVDDIAFLSKLAATLEDEHGFDPTRTYAIGISNGGFMAYHMACEAADIFEGISVIAASMPVTDWADCAPSRPTPVLHIHGRQDELIQWDGNSHWLGGFGDVPSIPEVIRSWAERNGAKLGFIEQRGNTRLEHYQDSDGRASVWFAAIAGFGHDLPNEENAGFSAMALSWEFFDNLGASAGS